ncbi:MAG: MATE family efflux transporter [Gemmatimonadota bacterium]
MTNTPTVEEKAPGTLTVILDALRGTHHDYTAGPIGRAIILLAIPMVMEMVMESIFAVVDVFFVSRLGPDAVATVGLTESMLTIIYTMAIGLSIGVTAMVARRIGEKNPDGASRVAVQGMALGLLVAIPIAVLGIAFGPHLLRAMGASPSVLASGSGFTRVMLGGNLAIILLFLINATFRGAGDAAVAMRVLWLANGINIVLDPCLIFGLGPFPALGVTGAAVATTTGRSIGVMFQLYLLFRKSGRIKLDRSHLRLEPTTMATLVRLSGTGMFQVFVGMASWIGLIRIISTFGSAAVAGYTIGIRLVVFALLPSWGLGNAAATMVGQGLGAGKPDRAERAVWIAGFYNMIFLGTAGLIFVIFTDPIIGIFTTDPAVHPVAVSCLRIISCGFLFYAYGMVITQSFNGAGDTWTPTLLNLFCFWIWEIPLAYVLANHFGMGPTGAFVSATTAFSLLALLSALLFRRGRWKTRKV